MDGFFIPEERKLSFAKAMIIMSFSDIIKNSVLSEFSGELSLSKVILSIVLAFVISLFIEQFMTITLVAKAFHGIKAAVAVLIISAAIKLSKSLKKDLPSMVMLGAVLAFEIVGEFLSFGISSIILIILGALMGVILYGVVQGRREGDGK